MARGSVGDVTFTRLKGQQVARVRNRQPSNPKTQKQMAQRSIFANAVRFFTRGNQNLFKFAFEDKKPNESDYNAFMRNNVANSVYISKTALGVTGYPAIGRWMMTNGTLPPIPMLDDIYAAAKMAPVPTGFGTSSQYDSRITFLTNNSHITSANKGLVSTFSQVLIENCYLSAGDIITFVQIYGHEEIGEYDSESQKFVLNGILPDAQPSSTIYVQEPLWKIAQIKLDTSDNRTLAEALGAGWEVTVGMVTPPGVGWRWSIGFEESGDSPGSCAACGVCMIASRNTAQGLKLSKQFLANNECTQLAIQEALSDNFKQLCVSDWQATEDAILQGSLVNEA